MTPAEAFAVIEQCADKLQADRHWRFDADLMRQAKHVLQSRSIATAFVSVYKECEELREAVANLNRELEKSYDIQAKALRDPPENEPRVIEWNSRTVITTGWTETGIPILAFRENCSEDEQSTWLGNMERKEVGAETVMIKLPTPESVLVLLLSLERIMQRMAEREEATKQ